MNVSGDTDAIPVEDDHPGRAASEAKEPRAGWNDLPGSGLMMESAVT